MRVPCTACAKYVWLVPRLLPKDWALVQFPDVGAVATDVVTGLAHGKLLTLQS